MANERDIQIFRDLIKSGVDENRAKDLINRSKETEQVETEQVGETLAQRSLRQAGEFGDEEKTETIQEGEEGFIGPLEKPVEESDAFSVGGIKEAALKSIQPLRDIGTKLSETGEKFKFQSNVDDGIIESGAKFIANLPGNTAQLTGGIITAGSNPLGTIRSIKELAGSMIETGLNKALLSEGQEVFTSEERKIISDSVSKELGKIANEPGRIKELLVENPADVLFAIEGGLKLASTTSAKLGLTKTTQKLGKLSEIISPINLQKTILTEGPKVPFKITAETIRKITPESISKKIAGIDTDTARVIKNTKKSRLDEILKEAQESIDDKGNVPSPFAIAGRKAEDALVDIGNLKKEAGASKGKELKKVQGKTINTGDIKSEFDNLMSERFNLKIDPETLKLKPIEGKISTVGDLGELQSLTDDLLEIFTRDKVDLGSLDNLVDKIQDTINFKKVPGKQDSKVVKTIKGFLEKNVNKRLKNKAGDKFTKGNEEFRRLLELENDLSKLLGPKGNRVEGLMKSVFSPQTGERTSKIFRQLREDLGIDLIAESKLAKFGMEAVGDDRAFNLLRALDLGPGFSQNRAALIQNALQSVFSPEKVGRSLAK